MKSKYLWHGSIRKLKTLKPSQARDISEHPDSIKKAVYATDIKDLAISFGLLEKNTTKFSSWTKQGKFKGLILIKGNLRKGKKLYLYKLAKKDFKKCQGISHQYVSEKEVIPLEILGLNVNNHKHLCRKATKKDIKYFENLKGKFKK